MICDKYAHLQQHLGHVFIYYKKADHVWQAALCATMKKYNISHDLVCSMKSIYNNKTIAFFHNLYIGEWFNTSVRVSQRCLLFPMLFNYILERIMTDELDGHVGTVIIECRQLTNLRFADEIDWLAWVDYKQHQGMEISGEKTKLMRLEGSGGIKKQNETTAWRTCK